MRRIAALLGTMLILITGFGVPRASCQAPGTQPSSPKEAKEKEEKCRISGMVVKAADDSPLKGAMVQLVNPDDHEHTIATKTTTDGRFELKNVPAGRYKVLASRNGWLPEITNYFPGRKWKSTHGRTRIF